MKLNKKNKKLLTYLYHHYREPLTKIAKECRISRDQVEYALKKYEKEDIIKKYLTIFNYNLLGYNEFVIVWMKVKNKKEQIKKELEGMKNVVSVGDIIPEYDIFVDFIFKSKQEFDEKFYSFLEKYKKEISEFEVFITNYSIFYPLKQFGIKQEEKSYEFIKQEKEVKIDDKDKQILKLIEKNGRARVVDIANEIGLSSELVIYKLKQLHNKKIVLGTRIQFDLKKLGFYFATLKLKLNNQGIKEKLENFCKNHPNINILAFGISKYNCIIQILYQDEKELRNTINEIKNNFDESILDSSLLLIEDEGKVKTLPY